ncbi:MAG: FkbM family methyltransferase [SAR324 cluster bacterium]|nr:FkbM family methyltransferase [SAR324 cluster bacterium]
MNHPLNKQNKLVALGNYAKWQVGSRLVPGPVVVDFVDESKIFAYPGMTGVTGNIYNGLDELEDMSFVLHCLKSSDLFLDIGANVGTYTVLAGAVRRAQCIAFEPIRQTFKHLLNNINLNQIQNQVEAKNIGIGATSEYLNFVSNQDTVNRVVALQEADIKQVEEVKVEPLDKLDLVDKPTVVKIDVEGFENEVIKGGKNFFSKNNLLAVILEWNSKNKYGSYSDGHKQMLLFGFRAYSYSPFERKLTALSAPNRDSNNTIYLKDKQKVDARIAVAKKFFVHKRFI